MLFHSAFDFSKADPPDDARLPTALIRGREPLPSLAVHVQHDEACMPTEPFMPLRPLHALPHSPFNPAPTPKANYQPGANWNPQNPPFSGLWNGFA
jgi:hypothetical protein